MEKSLEILTILQEECAELIVSISKIKRFNLTEENRERLEQEIADVLCLIELANTEGIVSFDKFEERKEIKKQKLKIYSKIYD